MSLDRAHPSRPSRRMARKARAWVQGLRWGLVLLAVAALVTAGWRYAHLRPAPTVRYQSVPADQGPLEARVTANGAVSAIVTVQVGSQVSGNIQHWYADFSASVKKGQLIAQIEPSLFKAAVAQARANYAAPRPATPRRWRAVPSPSATTRESSRCSKRTSPTAATVAAMTSGAAISSGQDGPAADQRVVWVLDRGHVTPRVVRIGITDGILTEVAEVDVRPGDAVVSEAMVLGAAGRKGS
jgi:HlyD family secretion protein